MTEKKQRLDWHKTFGQILQHRWQPLGLKIIPEYQVAKDPLRIDVVVVQTESLFNEQVLQQLPDGICDHLKGHNIIDFKSIRESYGYSVLKKTDLYAAHYELQEGVDSENLAVFVVSAMTPKKLLTQVKDWVQIWGSGIYQIQLSFRNIVLLIPNEMENKAVNDVFEIFSSKKDQHLRAIIRMLKDPSWSSLEGLRQLVQYLGKEWSMSGLNLEDFARMERQAVAKSLTPKKLAEMVAEMESPKEAIETVLSQLSEKEREELFQKFSKNN